MTPNHAARTITLGSGRQHHCPGQHMTPTDADAILATISRLRKDVAALRKDVAALRKDVRINRELIEDIARRQPGCRESWVAKPCKSHQASDLLN